MTTIPIELSDYILDFLHEDRKALKKCSLICRSWYPSARYHLYSRIYLPSPTACRLLHQLFESSSYLGQFTRYLNLSKAMSPTSDKDSEDTNSKLAVLWPPLFAALPHVEELELSFLEIDTPFHTALLPNFPRLTTLTLQYCRFPSFGHFAAALLSFPSLRQCTLRGISWESTQPAFAGAVPAERGSVPQISITSLTLGRDIDLQVLVEWLLQEHLCDALEAVVACCAFAQDAVILGELLRAAAPTLRHVDLDWYCASYTDVHLPFEFTLADCAALQTLSLRCPIALQSTVPWVNTLLDGVNRDSLEDLTLEFRLLGSLHALNWKRLEEILLQDTCKQLKAVNVKVSVWHTATERGHSMDSLVQARLPNLHSRGMLRFLD